MKRFLLICTVLLELTGGRSGRKNGIGHMFIVGKLTGPG